MRQTRDCSRCALTTLANAARYALIGDSKAAALYGGLVRTSLPGGRWDDIGVKAILGRRYQSFLKTLCTETTKKLLSSRFQR